MNLSIDVVLIQEIFQNDRIRGSDFLVVKPFQPLIATLWGMSSSRKYNTSTGKLVDCTNNVRLDALIFISASASSDIVSSYKRPLDCTAILNITYYNN